MHWGTFRVNLCCYTMLCICVFVSFWRDSLFFFLFICFLYFYVFLCCKKIKGNLSRRWWNKIKPFCSMTVYLQRGRQNVNQQHTDHWLLFSYAKTHCSRTHVRSFQSISISTYRFTHLFNIYHLTHSSIFAFQCHLPPNPPKSSVVCCASDKYTSSQPIKHTWRKNVIAKCVSKLCDCTFCLQI